MSKKMIDYKVEKGNISSIDGYSVGDKITAKKIAALYPEGLKSVGIDISTKTSTEPNDTIWMDIYGRYRVSNIFINLDTTIAAGTYRVGAVVAGNEISSRNQHVIHALAGYTYPASYTTAEDSKPIWMIGVNPDGTEATFILTCIKAGTYDAPEAAKASIQAVALENYQ